MAMTQFPTTITKPTPPIPHKTLLSQINFFPSSHPGARHFHQKPPKAGSFVPKKRRTGRAEAALGGLLGGLFGGTDTGDTTRQKYADQVRSINGLEPETARMTDSELRERTSALKERARSGESLDSLLPEAFSVVREASKRVLGLRHFDVQLIGGVVLHKGEIAEMKTGEGKTLVAICQLI